MSLRSKVLILVLGAALAVVAGGALATTFQEAPSTVASAVWGS